MKIIKVRKILCMLALMLAAFLVVGCGKEETKVVVPTGIALKIKTAKVQVTKSVSLTYTITPSSCQNDEVTVTVNNNLATATKVGNNKIEVTAGANTGNIKITVTTSNGISASKTIKIQMEEVQSYPDLSGYEIKIAQSPQTLGELDVKLTSETSDTLGYYAGADREFLQQAWDEIEDNYNCTFTVAGYPSDAPWGPSRWQYILTQAQNEAPEFDFYVTPDGEIPGYVAGNAILDLTDWYAEYGKNIMTEMTKTSGTYKGKLYSINLGDLNVYCIIGYNIGLLEKLQQYDPTLKEPAQMYLDGEWNYDTFKEYCIQVQKILDTNLVTDTEKYYCLSGYGTYYWKGMVNAAGVKVLDTTQLQVNITGTTETLAAQTLQDIYKAGAMDPAFQVDESVATWNAGHSLFNTGDFWFLNSPLRWRKDLWGEDNTRYGFVPYPTSPSSEITFTGTCTEYSIVMAAGREWAYEGYGADCTAENIYRAYMDYWTTARANYTSSEDYNRAEAITATAKSKFGNEVSVRAYLKLILGDLQEDGTYVNGIEDLGFYDPFIENSNPVVGNYGAAGTFGGDINVFIKGGDASADWVDAVGGYADQIKTALVEAYS